MPLSFLTTVIWKPVFSIQPEDVVKEEGRDAIFKCGATGFPSPEIKGDTFKAGNADGHTGAGRDTNSRTFPRDGKLCNVISH